MIISLSNRTSTYWTVEYACSGVNSSASTSSRFPARRAMASTQNCCRCERYPSNFMVSLSKIVISMGSNFWQWNLWQSGIPIWTICFLWSALGIASCRKGSLQKGAGLLQKLYQIFGQNIFILAEFIKWSRSSQMLHTLDLPLEVALLFLYFHQKF